MPTFNGATDALINRVFESAGSASPEDLVYLAKALEAVGVTSAVNFINATTEHQTQRITTTGDDEVARVIETMGDAVGVLNTKGDLLVHDGTGAARIPAGTEGQGLLAGPDGMPQWTPIITKVINVAHYSWSTISRVTWGNSYGNVFSGSDWIYRPLKNDSKILVLSELWASTNQNYAGAWTMWQPVDASGNALSGQSWRYGPGPEGEVYNSANPDSPSTFNPYNGSASQFGDLYDGDSNTSRKFASSLVFSPSWTKRPGGKWGWSPGSRRVRRAMPTCWCPSWRWASRWNCRRWTPSRCRRSWSRSTMWAARSPGTWTQPPSARTPSRSPTGPISRPTSRGRRWTRR